MKADTFKTSIMKMLSLPLWVKQIIYMSLRADIKRVLNNRPIDVNPYDMVQLYKPKITFKGKKELESREHNYEEIMYTFLKAVSERKTIIDVTLDNFLTLAETCELYLNALQYEYVMNSNSKVIDSTAQFFCGQIKTGEYLYRIGRISVDQLDTAIKTQDELKKAGDKTQMAEVISNFGFIEKDEIQAVLIMKDEAQRRLIYGNNINAAEVENKDVLELSRKIEELEYENNYLKTKLNALLKLGK